MERLKLILFSLFIISYDVHASEKSSQDEKITDILQEISEKYQNYDNFRVEYRYILNDPEDDSEQEPIEGELVMEGDSRYRLTMRNDIITTDGKYKWVYLSTKNIVTKTVFDIEDEEERLFLRLKKIILYPTEWLTPVLFEKKENLYIIELEPLESCNEDDEEDNMLDLSNKVSSVTLEIDENSKELRSWRIETANGIQETYIITNFTPNIKIKKKFFKFDTKKYEGVIENDLT